MVAISCGAENFEMEDGVRGDVCMSKAALSRFKVENVRCYPERGVSA